MSLNEDIRDDLVEHDIDVRRVDGDLRNRIDKRYDELNRELRELLVRHDPHGAKRIGTRKKRLAAYEKDARKAVNAALTDINALIRKTISGIARAETSAVIDSIVESI